MNLDFTKEQKMLMSSAREFLVPECPKDLVREIEESETGFREDLWAKMAELGWMGLIIPEDYEGIEMTYFDLVLLLEEMGRNLLPGPFFSTVLLGTVPIIEAGTDSQKQEFLPKIVEGDIRITLAHAEPGAFYDPSDVNVQAVPDSGGYVINGTKLFVENAHISEYLICSARTSGNGFSRDGITLFLVDAKDPGITTTVVPTIGLDRLCEVQIKDVKVSEDQILGQKDNGWAVLEKVLERAAIGKCAEMVGGIKACLEMTNDYVKKRVAYGRIIGSFQVIQHYLANVWIDMETSRNITYEAAWRINEGLPCTMKAAVAKAWVGQAFGRVTERCIQMHGAIGMTREQDVGLYHRRAKAWDLAFGDADYQREIVAQQLEMG
ncbi:MAG: acyl-CoA dehydrogenase [Thermodesulfobacteriota bacterium]|nr:acyl-CoA dehydrogenase [Thermodesulfobacteriota bacterium]